MGNALITAIVPCGPEFRKNFQGEKWLPTVPFSHYEIIFVLDNVSAQNSDWFRKLISNLKLKSELIKIYEVHYGAPGLTRNFGKDQAKSDWICFWDSDDIPDSCEFLKMVQSADLKGHNISIGKFESDNFHQKILHTKKMYNSLSQFRVSLNPGIWRWAFRREVLIGFSFSALIMGEDQLFLAPFFNRKFKKYRHPMSVYTYLRYPSGQLTGNKIKVLEVKKSIKATTSFLFFSKYRNLYALVMLIRQAGTYMKALLK